ncbi:hypothetical protein GFY24_25170 [Nocardia sp. SYP-A9097]|uniref:hypothetical protein n=1 Tax=Nocardia sp. SYP-A9097 TaxID=2663237 RepID=UPI00129AE42B|nr:hypothetical protein [Nocardia sp. SYP-A9097]MRH90692.1 hypothetical protein [Nocardia sp. SYP-A9097]
MSTYLDSPSLPFRLQFASDEPAAVATAAQAWVAHGQIFTIALTNESGAVENRYLLVNFGAMSCLTVHDQDKLDDPSHRLITYSASLTESGDLAVETRSLAAHTG